MTGAVNLGAQSCPVPAAISLCRSAVRCPGRLPSPDSSGLQMGGKQRGDLEFLC